MGREYEWERIVVSIIRVVLVVVLMYVVLSMRSLLIMIRLPLFVLLLLLLLLQLLLLHVSKFCGCLCSIADDECTVSATTVLSFVLGLVFTATLNYDYDASRY